ncbi:hypothetical protein IHE44_0000438 [Lamprotornis superbus]|uniref:Uncharacterized protein n=1 Tax=Lamprotornis superbus TaxID=245042 RepID=A0A835TXU2_9PASS|nr:hypothetical protein IHE44_0000438 [Lamprotornis superbus]
MLRHVMPHTRAVSMVSEHLQRSKEQPRPTPPCAAEKEPVLFLFLKNRKRTCAFCVPEEQKPDNSYHFFLQEGLKNLASEHHHLMLLELMCQGTNFFSDAVWLNMGPKEAMTKQGKKDKRAESKAYEEDIPRGDKGNCIETTEQEVSFLRSGMARYKKQNRTVLPFHAIWKLVSTVKAKRIQEKMNTIELIKRFFPPEFN